MCDDTETDPRVNLQACRKLGARSMVAVPLCGRRRVIGLLEAFSAWPFAFNDSDVRNLSLLAELVLGALKPEDEDRFAESAQAAATKLETPPRPAPAPPVEPPKVARVAPPAVVARPVVASTVVTPSVKVPPALAPTGAAAPVVRGPAAPVADKKPAAPQVSSAPASAVLNKPAIFEQPAEKPLQLEKAAGAETPTAPELNLLQPELASRRPVLLILLVFIVICAAFAGGVWLFKTTQLGNATLRTEKMPVKPSSTSAANQPPAAPVPAVPAGASPANAAADAASDAGEADSVTGDSAGVVEVSYASPESATGPRPIPARWSSTWKIRCSMRHIAWPDPTASISICAIPNSLPSWSENPIEVGDAFVSRIRVAQPVAGMTRIVLRDQGRLHLFSESRTESLPAGRRSTQDRRDSQRRGEPVPERRRRGKEQAGDRGSPADERRYCNCGRACPRCASWLTPATAAGTSARLAAADCSKKIWCLKSPSVWASCSKAAWVWK